MLMNERLDHIVRGKVELARAEIKPLAQKCFGKAIRLADILAGIH